MNIANKLHYLLFFSTILTGCAHTNSQHSTGKNSYSEQINSSEIDSESIMVTFECQSCRQKNEFYISGKQDFNFLEVKFPLEVMLKPGQYEMTYWQNKVQQIRLPFSVTSNSNRRIKVK